MFLKEIYSEMKEVLGQAGLEKPDLEARIIIEERAGFDWSDIVTCANVEVSSDVCEVMRKDVLMRIKGKPLSRIYNKREFWGREFLLSSDTLDPRPDTELIIELALERFKDISLAEQPQNILDMGTGSGCVLIALLCEFPKAQGVGVDLSQGALDMAAKNAQQNGVADRAGFVNGSWWSALDAQKVQQKFDLIVSNPPYISNQVIPTLAPEVKNHDPVLALDGGDDGLDAYKIIFSRLKKHLSRAGIALLEIGYDQENDVMRLSEESGFALRSVHNDLAGNPRVVEISCGDK